MVTPAIAVPAIVLTALAVVLWQPRWLIEALARRSPRVLYFVPTQQPLVALTIDDGPDPSTTPEILRVLREHDARATFFLIGRRASRHAQLVHRITREGHELANHMSRDRPSHRLTGSEFEAAMLEADSILSEFGSLRWLRPGGGWYSDTMLSLMEAHGYRCVLGSVYPYDAEIPFTSFAVFHVLRKARPGAIIILHDGGARGERAAETLREVLPGLERRGLRAVSVSELVRETLEDDKG